MDLKEARKRSFSSSGLPADGSLRQSKKKKKQDDKAKLQQTEPSGNTDANPALIAPVKDRSNKRQRRREKQRLQLETGDSEAGRLSAAQPKTERTNVEFRSRPSKKPVKDRAVAGRTGQVSGKQHKEAKIAAIHSAPRLSAVINGATAAPTSRSNKRKNNSHKKKKRKDKITASRGHDSPRAAPVKGSNETFSIDWKAIERSAAMRLATEDFLWSNLTQEQRAQMEEHYIGRAMTSTLAAHDEEGDSSKSDDSGRIQVDSSSDTSSDEEDIDGPPARQLPIPAPAVVSGIPSASNAGTQAAQAATALRKENKPLMQPLASRLHQPNSRGLFKPFGGMRFSGVPATTNTNDTLANTQAKFERLSAAIKQRRQEGSSDSDDDSSSESDSGASGLAMRGSIHESFASHMPTLDKDEEKEATPAAEESEAGSDDGFAEAEVNAIPSAAEAPCNDSEINDETAELANMDDPVSAPDRASAASHSPDEHFEADISASPYAAAEALAAGASPLNENSGSEDVDGCASGQDDDLEHEELPEYELQDQDADEAAAEEEEHANFGFDNGQSIEGVGHTRDGDDSSHASEDDIPEEDVALPSRHAARASSAGDSTTSDVDASNADMSEAPAQDVPRQMDDVLDSDDVADAISDLDETNAEAQDGLDTTMMDGTSPAEIYQAAQNTTELPVEAPIDSSSDDASDRSREEPEDVHQATNVDILGKPATVVQSAIEPPRTQLTASQRQEAAGIPQPRPNTSSTANDNTKTTTASTDRGGASSGHSRGPQAQANNDSTLLSFKDFVPVAIDPQANTAAESQELDSSVLEDVFDGTRPLPEGEDSKIPSPPAGTEDELLTNNDSIPHNSSKLSSASVDAGHRNTTAISDSASQVAPPPELNLSDSDTESSEDVDDPGSSGFEVAIATKDNANGGNEERAHAANHPRDIERSDDTTNNRSPSPSTPIASVPSNIPAAVLAAINIATGKSPVSSVKRRKMTGNKSTHFSTPTRPRLPEQSHTQTTSEKLPVSSRQQRSELESTEQQESGHLSSSIKHEPTDAPTSTRKRRSPAKKTGTISEHFIEDRVDLYNTTAGKRRKVPAGQSGNPFPPTGQPLFGIIQEKTWQEPFWMIVATVLLNKTTGRQAAPTFWKIKRRWPEAADLANADYDELFEMIKHLGLQHQRTKRLQALAAAWNADPPQSGKRHRTLHYPGKDDGKQFKKSETIEEDADDCAGALEIAHIPGCGPYSWDSWRIFCRDVLRGVAEDYRGTNAKQDDFEPEWKRVVPGDKELRAYLRWMWLKEGIVWDPLTGNRRDATAEEMDKAERGEVELEDEVEAKFAAQAAGADISSPEKVTRGDYALGQESRRELRALDIPVDGPAPTQEVDKGADWALKNSQAQTTDVEGSQREASFGKEPVMDVGKSEIVQRKRRKTSDGRDERVRSEAAPPNTRRTRAKKGDVRIEETTKSPAAKKPSPANKNEATNTVTTRRQSARLLENTGLV
ncbi:hypothetical protein CBER1_01661 [Cercospora berteroae]|uniref:HhH-GPD domain-containing protein n=1 Tax=Cercospora berteroae TaxID=357750 RepID=A0A2S6CHB0_9PEZI|nr:hypothetical protein CBER1_01661 [Cercospora berteroae]